MPPTTHQHRLETASWQTRHRWQKEYGGLNRAQRKRLRSAGAAKQLIVTVRRQDLRLDP